MKNEQTIIITAYDIAFSLCALLLFGAGIFFPSSVHGLRASCVGVGAIIFYLFACEQYFNSHVLGKVQRMKIYLMAVLWLQRLTLLITGLVLIEYGFL